MAKFKAGDRIVIVRNTTLGGGGSSSPFFKVGQQGEVIRFTGYPPDCYSVVLDECMCEHQPRRVSWTAHESEMDFHTDNLFS